MGYYVLSPHEIASALITFAEHLSLTPVISLEPDAFALSEQQAFTRICQILARATDVNFLAYRPATLQRRILRRMGVMQIDQMLTYTPCLDDHPAEVEALSQEVLIRCYQSFPGSEHF